MVALYIHWLYTHEIVTKVDLHSEEGSKDYERLTNAHILSDKPEDIPQEFLVDVVSANYAKVRAADDAVGDHEGTADTVDGDRTDDESSEGDQDFRYDDCENGYGRPYASLIKEDPCRYYSHAKDDPSACYWSRV